MGHLQLRLLGHPRVRHEETAVEFRTRKALALLVYLAIEEGMHAREKLAAIFWPQNDASSGRANLRNTLALLRKPLRHRAADAKEATAGKSHLIATRNALGFNRDTDFTSDWHLLQQAVLDRGIDSLQEIVDRYRGDFLDGFILGDAPEFDDWARLHREQAHRQLETVFGHLSQKQMESGKAARALNVTNRWLQHNPLSEAAYRRLMRLHLMQGDRQAALDAYRQCRSTLDRELDAEPEAETIALAERIRTAEDQGKKQAVDWPASSRPRAAQDHETVSLPLIGRGREYRRLVAAFYSSAGGDPQVPVIEGQAGIGKTRLTGEFLRWAAAQGADVLRGRAFEAGGRVPYHPLVQALRPRVEAENAPEDLLSDVWLTELSRLLPELRDRYPDLSPPPAGEAAARTRFFEAVTRLGSALAAHAPLVLFIDDLQWADTATLDLLHYAAGRWHEEQAPILLLLTLRSEALLEPLGGTSTLEEWLDGLAQTVASVHLQLGPLTTRQTRELMETMTGNGPQAAVFADWLYEETDGQPFYVQETLKALLDQEWLRLVQDQEEPRLDVAAALDENGNIHPQLRGFLPPGVHKVVRQRLSRLSQDGFVLATAGAALGQTFSFENACRLADIAQHAALRALDELLANRILQEVGDQAAQPYNFSHDKIRDVVYTEAGDARRRLFHRRALSTLREAGAPAAELAHHALQAGLAETAVRHSITAGDEAMQLFAVRDAAGYYEQARQILAEQAGVDVETDRRLHLHRRLGRAYDILGDLHRAETIYGEMAALAREQVDLTTQALALNRLATIKAYQSDIEAALSLLEEALPIARRSGDRRGLAETHWNFAQMALYGGGVQQMGEHGRKALQLAREGDDAELIARCLNSLAYNARNQGQASQAMTYGEEALERYRELGDRPLVSDCLGLLSQANLMAGRPQSAVAYAREALAISRDVESPHGIGFNGLMLILALVETARSGEAADLFEELRASTAWRSPHEQIMAQLMAGIIHRACGDVDAALKLDEESLSLINTHGDELPIPLKEIAAISLTEDYALRGKWEAAAAHADQVPQPSPSVWFFLLGHFRWWLVVEALLRSDHEVQARDLVKQLQSATEGYPRFRLAYRRSLAVLARRDGNLDKARQHLQTAVSLAREMALPGEKAQASEALAALEEERED